MNSKPISPSTKNNTFLEHTDVLRHKIDITRKPSSSYTTWKKRESPTRPQARERGSGRSPPNLLFSGIFQDILSAEIFTCLFLALQSESGVRILLCWGVSRPWNPISGPFGASAYRNMEYFVKLKSCCCIIFLSIYRCV